MKTIKTLFAILFLTTLFLACETDNVNEEIGFDETELDIYGSEEEEGRTQPAN